MMAAEPRGRVCALVIGVCLVVGGASQGWAEPGWTQLASLDRGLGGEGTTKLLDGRVMVAGGWSSSATARCEIYEPGADAWTETGSLSQSRSLHAAVTLADGRVLVAGGAASNPLGTEIWDPSTGAWSAGPALSQVRDDAAAVVLDDGSVFIWGGTGDTAEVMDPGVTSWTETTTTGASRSSATATLLQDGRVLVAGGYNSSAVQDASLLYDPVGQTWAWTSLNVAPRWRHTATLLPDGRVVIIGGRAAGATSVSLASAEIYDPATDTWSPAGAMSAAREAHTATLMPDGRVLVAGGVEYDGATYGPKLSSVEIFDPATGMFTAGPPLANARQAHGAVLLDDGAVFVAGGADSTRNATAEKYSAFPDGTVAATFDAGLGVPSCDVASGCTSGMLLDRRGTLEPNSPNVLAGSCTDGSADPDLAPLVNRLVIRTVNGEPLAPGSQVVATLEGVGTIDNQLDLYYAADVLTQDWTPLASLVVDDAGGDQTLEATFVLAAGGNLQAIRGAARLSAASSPCEPGPYNDHDDLVFAVAKAELAELDAELGVPSCSLSTACDSDMLLQGRGGFGTEVNQPNTILGSCADGSASGEDEAVQRIRVQSLDDGPLVPGRMVEVQVTALPSLYSDFLSLYYAPDAANPQWTHVQTLELTGGVEQTRTFYVVLGPGGRRQAVRAAVRGEWAGPGEPPACVPGEFVDHDDLAFEVGAADVNAAVFDAALSTPRCPAVGTNCDSLGLLVGMGPLGPEPNAPNTTLGLCEDGTATGGTFHVEPSVDRIRVSEAGGGTMVRGQSIEVAVSVFASAYYSSERIDLFAADDSTSPPSWAPVGSLVPTGPGLQTLSFSYTPAGTSLVQGVRASSRFSGASGDACAPDEFTDHDDLWFRLDSGGGTHALFVEGVSTHLGAGTVEIAYDGGSGFDTCAVTGGTPAHCVLELTDADVATLTAVPEPNHIFTGWTGACSGTGSCTVTMSEARQVGAEFATPPQELRVMVASQDGGSGGVLVEPLGETCTAAMGTCTYSVDVGADVTLTATPASDSVLVELVGPAPCDPASGPTCTFRVEYLPGFPIPVDAVFRGPEELTVEVMSQDGGLGSVLVEPLGETCTVETSPCSYLIKEGTEVTLTATPGPNSVFLNMWAACDPESPTCTFPITYNEYGGMAAAVEFGPLLTIGIGDASVQEGEDGTTTITFTVTATH